VKIVPVRLSFRYHVLVTLRPWWRIRGCGYGRHLEGYVVEGFGDAPHSVGG
jgi:hypothetical protein